MSAQSQRIISKQEMFDLCLTAYLKVRSVLGFGFPRPFGVQKTLVQSVPCVLVRLSGVQKVPFVNKCGVKVVWRDLKEHPSWEVVIDHGDRKSPK